MHSPNNLYDTHADPESKSNVTISKRPLESLDYDLVHYEAVVAAAVNAAKPFEDLYHIHGNGSTELHQDPSPPKPGKYFHEFGDIIISPFSDHIDSNFLWYIQKSDYTRGGLITLKFDRVRFQHMNTGMWVNVVMCL